MRYKFIKPILIFCASLLIIPFSSKILNAGPVYKCAANTNLGPGPCLVVNEPKFVCGPYVGPNTEPNFTYKQECTLQEIVAYMNSYPNYCTLMEDGKQVNTIVFQALKNPDTEIIESTITTIDSPITFNLQPDQKVVLSGMEALYGGGSTPFLEFDKDKPFGEPWVQCKYKWSRAPLNLVEKPDYKVRIDIKNVPPGEPAIIVNQGTLVLRNMILNAVCKPSADVLCTPPVRVINGGQLILDHSTIYAVQESVGSEFVPHFSSVIEILGPFKERLGDNVAFREHMDSDHITGIFAASDNLIKVDSIKTIYPSDFEGLRLDRMGFEYMKDGERVNAFWEGDNRLIKTPDYPVTKCIVIPGQNKCSIDNSSGVLNFKADVPVMGQIMYVTKEDRTIKNAGNFEINGANYIINLPAGLKLNEFEFITNLGQKIDVICASGSSMLALSDGTLSCYGIKTPFLTGVPTLSVPEEGAEVGAPETTLGTAIRPRAQDLHLSEEDRGGRLSEEIDISEAGLAPYQKSEADSGFSCAFMHISAVPQAGWLIFLAVPLGAIIWRRSRH